MLNLLIRTDQLVAELYLFSDTKCLAEYSWNAERRLAETINIEIDRLLSKAGKKLGDLNGIGVYSGPGSFTSLRIGLSTANALALGLGIPIVQSNDEDWKEQAIDLLEKGQDKHIVLPEYGAPARITLPRK